MARLIRLALAFTLVLLATAIPAGAQTQDSTNTGPSVSVTFVPMAGLRGGDFDFGEINHQVTQTVFDPRTGNGDSNSSRSVTGLTVKPGHEPMILFAVESGQRNGLALAGGGWVYSSDETTANHIVSGKGDFAYIIGRNFCCGDAGGWSARQTWKVKAFDGGVTMSHSRPSANLKLFVGGEFVQIQNGTSVQESDTSTSAYPEEGYFSHTKSSTAATATASFNGFGPLVGFAADIRLRNRVTLHNSFKGGFLLGSKAESENYASESATMTSFLDEDNRQLVQNHTSKSVLNYNVDSMVVVEKIQEELSVVVKLGRFELGGGLFMAIFKNVSAAPQDGSAGPMVSPVLAGGTVSATYRW